MSQETTTANDLVPETADVHYTRTGEAVVPIDDLDVTLGAEGDCRHVYWYNEEDPEMDARLYALEPDPYTGYWTCCPNCGLTLGQRNLGEVPAELRTL